MSDDTSEALDNLDAISRGGVLYITGISVQYAAGFAVEVVLSRSLGTAMYGVYAFSKRVSSIILGIVKSGSNTSLLRYVPSEEREEAEIIVGLVYVMVLVVTLIVCSTLLFLSPTIAEYTLAEPALVVVLRIFGLIILFEVLIGIIGTTFRAFEVVSVDIAVQNIAKPLAVLLAVVIGLFLDVSIQTYVTGIAIANGVVLVGAAVFLIRWSDIMPRIEFDRKRTIEILSYSAVTSGSRLGTFLYTRADIVMIGFLLTSSDVGIYNVAILLTSFLKFPHSALNQLFPPIASRLYENDDHDTLDAIYTAVTRWSIIFTLLPAVWMLVYRYPLLNFFGNEFTEATVVLVLLVGGQVVASIVGPSGFLLLMSGNERIAALNRWSTGILNVAINYVAINAFGVIGAAIVTASMFALLNVLRVVEITWLEGLYPYEFQILKPVIATIPAAAGMHVVSEVFNGLPGVLVGGVLGTFLYIFVLVVLGLDELDKQLLSNYYDY